MSNNAKLKNWWASRTPKQKRMAVVIPVTAALLLLLLWVASIDPNTLIRKQAQAESSGNLLGSADSRSMTLASLQEQLSELRRNNDVLLRKQTELEERLKAAQTDPRRGSGGSATPRTNAQSYLGDAGGSTTPANRGPRQAVLPPPSTSAPIQSSQGGPGTSTTSGPSTGRSTGPTRRGQGNAVSEQPPRAAPIRRAPAPVNHVEEDVIELDSVEPAEVSSGVFIPAGSIFTGVLLAGVDAPTGRGSTGDPIPVLARVKEQAILPNRFQADVRECFIVASAIGDLSSERAQLRSEALSCVRHDGGVIETRLAMYGVGEDGKAGVRGRLVSKQGQVISRALIAGFADGMARAFAPQRIPVISTSGQGGFQTIDGSEAFQAGALGGMGSALERLSQFYIRMAESMFPVIEVDAGREVSFVVTQGGEVMLLDP